MKYFLLISFVLLFCVSIFNCQEIEGEDEDEDYKTEEEDSETDLELIPSFKTKPKDKNKPGQTIPAQEKDEGELPLTSIVSSLEKRAFGLFGTLRDRLGTRVSEVGKQFQDANQKLSKRIEGRVIGLMQNLPF